MRGNPQAASLRLRAAMPARRWSAWLMQAQERRQRVRLKELEVTERLRAEERRARRSGTYAPNVRCRL
jgi:hypothetical protein